MSKMAGRAIGIITSLVATCSLSMSAFATAMTTENTEEILLQYDHIEELSDGGKIYVYIIDGIENSFPVPPDEFDPLNASDETLATYGFPPRPSDVHELDEWIENMEAMEQLNERTVRFKCLTDKSKTKRTQWTDFYEYMV